MKNRDERIQNDIMRVGKLIKELQKLDPNTIVVTDDGRGCITPVTSIEHGYCWRHPNRSVIDIDFKLRHKSITIDDHAELGVWLI